MFEIKSTWTYDFKCSDLERRKINNKKWLSALQQGYRMFIVLDKKFLFEVFEEDFNDISRSVLKETLFDDNFLISLFK